MTRRTIQKSGTSQRQIGRKPVCVSTLADSLSGDKFMKRIPLTRGKYAIIDDENFEELSKYKWFVVAGHSGYRAGRRTPRDTNGKQTTIYMHRAIMGLSRGDPKEVDHINHNTLDNRRQNMRVCTRKQNRWNEKARRGCTSKYKGICKPKGRNKWEVRIRAHGCQMIVGYFYSEIEAANCYDEAAKKHFGEFAFLNFPETK